MYDLNKQAQAAYKSLQKHKRSLTVVQRKAQSNHQRRIKVKLTDSVMQEMSYLYDEYNTCSVAVESMSARYSAYYKEDGMMEEQPIVLFSECVSCSQRLLT